MRVEGPLDELAVFVCTPARSGVYLTKGELIALARATDASLRVGERAWMLSDVLKASPTTAALAERIERLRVFAAQSLAHYERIAAEYPTAAPAMAPWIARAKATIDRLAVLAEEVRL